MAGKKRKSDAAQLAEVYRTMYSSFCGAANSLSQLYTQAMAHQKPSFQAGERHALEKLGHWILRQHEESSRMTTNDILAHIQSLQNELDYGGDGASLSPRQQFQQQHPQTQALFTSSSTQNSCGLPGEATTGLTAHVNQSDHAQNSVFPAALSNHVHHGFQPYHLSQGGGFHPQSPLPSGNGRRSHLDLSIAPGHNRESSSSFHDSSMDCI